MDETTTKKIILDSGLVLGLRLVQTLELFLIFVSIISGSVVLLVFYRTPLLHRNLLGLMGMIGSEFFLVMISRVFMLGFSFDNEDYLGGSA
uniref:Uncharacterized protein n=1 Tax=Panagrolaimus sp. JU765 TaxID=591449 RepID=A0AC34R266_9BILA